jgi:hypothetical protein
MLELLHLLGARMTAQSTAESNDVQAGSTPLHMLCRVKGGSDDDRSACVRFLCSFGHTFIKYVVQL